MPIKIIAITTANCIFCISSVFKLQKQLVLVEVKEVIIKGRRRGNEYFLAHLNKCITRGPWWDLEIDVCYRSILQWKERFRDSREMAILN